MMQYMLTSTSHHGNSIASKKTQSYVSRSGSTSCDELTVEKHDVLNRAGFTVVGALALSKCGGPCQ
jgi:hypothetical protein